MKTSRLNYTFNAEEVVEQLRPYVTEVKETKGLFLFFLDKQTVIILPKETYQNGSDFTSFKEFISTKINVKRIKFLKDKLNVGKATQDEINAILNSFKFVLCDQSNYKNYI